MRATTVEESTPSEEEGPKRPVGDHATHDAVGEERFDSVGRLVGPEVERVGKTSQRDVDV